MTFTKPPAERFWKYVERRSPNECWNWTATRIKIKGVYTYGHFFGGDKLILAHRFSWELAYGPIPKGMLVLHHCDHPECVNPNHLFLGTHADNARDMTQKGRHGIRAIGFTQAKIDDLKAMYATGLYTQMELSEIFSISLITVSRYINGHYSRVAAPAPACSKEGDK